MITKNEIEELKENAFNEAVAELKETYSDNLEIVKKLEALGKTKDGGSVERDVIIPD